MSPADDPAQFDARANGRVQMLERELEDIRASLRPNYQTWIYAGVLVVGAFAAIASWMLAPVQRDIIALHQTHVSDATNIERQLEAVRSEMRATDAQLRAEIAAAVTSEAGRHDQELDLKLEALRTLIRWNTDVRNLREATLEQQLRALWSKVYGTDLPPADLPPAGPPP